MKADILSIADEILIGQTLNTNAHWMARKLTEIGIGVRRITSISDEREDILQALDSSIAASDIVLITGGLGPTNDDLTRDTLAEYFESELTWDDKVLKAMEAIFVHRGRVMTNAVKDMARVPDKATTIYNTMGTAPGALYEHEGKVIVSMPGVPYEMRAMMEQDVLPWLQTNRPLPVIVIRHILTAGQGESQLADKITDIEDSLDPAVKLAYLPDVGKVKLRLTARGEQEGVLREKIEVTEARILERIGKYVYGFDGDQLEASIGRSLQERGLSLSTAESCTGGTIAGMITSIPGSSAYFMGSIVSYSNRAKLELLDVATADLDQHGAVSEPVVRQMVIGANKRFQTDVAIAVSGVAGPGGGSKEKPVGTVFIGVGSAEKQWVKRFQFTSNRGKNVEITAVVALVMLRKFIIDEFVQEGQKE